MVAMQPSSSGITRKVRPLIVPDIVADAAQLPFANESLDFVVASHVLEYLPLPLRALANWYSGLRVGGFLLLKVPDKRYTFDAGRARTHLEHLLIEDLNPEKFDRPAHFEDWVQYVGGRESGSHALQVETDQLMDNDYSIHYHVWRDDDLLELIRHARPDSGPHPWLDEPDALERIEGKLTSGVLTPKEAGQCRDWAANGYIILERLIDESVLDDVWEAYEFAVRAAKIQLPPEPAGEGDPYPGRYLNPHRKAARFCRIQARRPASLASRTHGAGAQGARDHRFP